VPCVIEALAASRFRDVTHLVNEEADKYCAAFARAHEAIILTGDTDLLLYDTGPDGRVIFFEDVQDFITLPPSALTSTMIRVRCHEPARIAKLLGLKGLIHLGYEVKSDYSKTIGHYINNAKQHNIRPCQSYEQFCRQYAPPPGLQDCITYLHSVPNINSFHIDVLDPRLSECVNAVLEPPTNVMERTMYLPNLFEDPSRASAWNVGIETRRTSYSVLQLCLKSPISMYENTRHGHRATSEKLHLIAAGELPANVSDTVSLFSRSMMPFHLMSLQMQWRLFCITMVHAYLVVEQKSLPTLADVRKLLTGMTELDWSLVHLEAQVQAIFYSVRMLKQCTDVTLALLPEQEGSFGEEHLHDRLLELRAALKSLPSIGDAFPSPSDKIEDATIQEAIALYSIVTGTQQVDEPANESLPGAESRKLRKKKKRQKQDSRKPASPKPQDMQSSSKNIFDLLKDGDDR
jgi:hypothetical protein